MNNALHSSYVVDLLTAVGLIVAGVLMFIYRKEIGAVTGSFNGTGRFIDKPTPGWMLIPFALVLIAGGISGIVHLW